MYWFVSSEMSRDRQCHGEILFLQRTNPCISHQISDLAAAPGKLNHHREQLIILRTSLTCRNSRGLENRKEKTWTVVLDLY